MLMIPAAVRANISLATFFMEFDADSARRTGQLRFTNTSDKTQTYDIRMVNFSQNSDGEYKEIDTPSAGNPFAEPYLDWSPRRITLAPMQSQVVRVARRPMAAAPDGEYVSHLMIRETAPNEPADTTSRGGDGLKINLRALYGVSIPVMIEKGDPRATAAISSVEIYNAGGKPLAAVMVRRGGNRSFYGTLVVSEDGREIGRVSKFRIFMTTSARVLKIPLLQRPTAGALITLIDENTNETVDQWTI